MARKYPSIHSVYKKQKGQSSKKCVVCGEKADFIAEISISYMRGDDIVKNVCSDKTHIAIDIMNGKM